MTDLELGVLFAAVSIVAVTVALIISAAGFF